MILNKGSLSVEQVKLLCEIYLDSIGLVKERERLARRKAILPEIPEGSNKTEVEIYISNFLKEFNLVSRSSDFYGFMYEHLSRMNLSGIISLYANTKAMEMEIAKKLRKIFGREPDGTALANIHKKFVELTETTYGPSFVVENNPLGYLCHSYDRFFQNTYSKFISRQMNSRGTTFIGEDGSIEDSADFDERGDLNDIKATFDIPNFKQIAHTIYEGTKALKFDKNDDGSFLYDIFSYKKAIIVNERFDKIKANLTKRSSTLKQVFEFEDLNKDLRSDAARKRWNHRKNILDSMCERNVTLNLEEPFEDIYSLYGKGKQTNTGFVFLKEDTDPVTEKINKLNAAQTFLKIKQGINACDELIRLLGQNNIDPLSVPSDIFRDEKWLAKVSSFKAYMLMYDNIKELDSKEKLVGNIYSNDELFRNIQLNELRGIANRNMGAIGNIVGGDMSACSYPSLNVFIKANKSRIAELIQKVQVVGSTFSKVDKACKALLKDCETVFKEDYVRDVRRGKIVDWKYPPPEFMTNVRRLYNSISNLPDEKKTVSHKAFINNYKIVENFSSVRLKLGMDKPTLFNDLLTSTNIVLKIGLGLLKCLNILNEDYLSDIRIIDMVDANKNLIKMDRNFDASRDLVNIRELQGAVVMIPKKSPTKVSYSLVNRNVLVSLSAYKDTFAFLQEVLAKVSEHGRRGYHSTPFILGTYETKLIEYGNTINFLPKKATSSKFILVTKGKPVYHGYILHNVGKPIVEIFEGRKYYLHQSGYWITGELDFYDDNVKRLFNDNDNILKMS